MSPIILKLVIYLLVVAVLSASVAAARRSSPTFDAEGRLVMRPSLPIRIFYTSLFIAPPVLIATFMLTGIQFKNADEVVAVGTMLLVACVLCGFMYWITSRRCVIVDEEGIAFVSCWGRPRTYPWCDVVEITTQHEFPLVFRMRDNRVHKLPGLFTGADLLVAVIRARVPAARCHKASAAMASLSAGKTNAERK